MNVPNRQRFADARGDGSSSETRCGLLESLRVLHPAERGDGARRRLTGGVRWLSTSQVTRTIGRARGGI